MALSPAGRVAFVGVNARGDERILVTDSTGSPLHEIKIGLPTDLTLDAGHPRKGSLNPRPEVRQLALDSASETLAVGIRPWRSKFNGHPLPGRLEVWKLGTGEVRSFKLTHAIPEDGLERPLEDIGLLRYSPDGRYLFQGFRVRDGAVGGRAIIRDARTLAELSRYVWHLSTLTGVSWSPAGLVTSSLDGTAAAWPKEGGILAPSRAYDQPRESPDKPSRSLVPSLGSPPHADPSHFQRGFKRGVPGAAERSAQGLWAIDGGPWSWEGKSRSVVLAGTGQGELILWDRETGATLSRWEAHSEGKVVACRLLQDGLILSVAKEAKLWIQFNGQFYQLSQTRLGRAGADVLSVDIADGKVAALTIAGGLREIVLVDLDLPPLHGFADNPKDAIRPHLRDWVKSAKSRGR
ncbi:MAG: hypothetical protein JKY65_13545 [Planctomycetes bacterium]|nr:hypothetical protein [Planctomycetota bacterium]